MAIGFICVGKLAGLFDENGICQMIDSLFDQQDFFIDNHWEKMPNSWIETMSSVLPENLCDLLMPPDRPSEKVVWPLSLLALRKSLERLCIPRKTTLTHSTGASAKIVTHQSNDPNNNPNVDRTNLPSAKMKSILMKKKIKAKKQHEIERMGELTAKIAGELNVKYVVDFGSGLGHLARFLAYGCGLNVCCLEKERALIDQAK